ncbi:hypothetical protein [Parenemella sanctibonifatiensis]|uniref:Uncharacterized protein n=1 Tax=Parenemella sanctibonifatiensis TaxID=2016505 RepID=A0A255EDK5_9ACTN|nr:hypothetical protein [Parenemella sanctibonifatiensis]OYN89350.1 hypothetical protein CGZ91_10625 [Parenemella sanctibonifatiensis]
MVLRRICVQTMRLIQRLSDWVNRNSGVLKLAGDVTFRLNRTDKPAAHLLIKGAKEAELILWESGEMEVWVYPMSYEEHHRIGDADALERILSDFLDRVGRSGR